MLTKNKIKTLYHRSLLSFACLSVIAFTGGCSSSNTSSDGVNQNTNAQSNDMELAVVSDFADQVVIPTYNLLVKKTDGLNKAVDKFVSNPNDANLKTAQQAWIETRYPWEKSEAFAFGPASSLGYDGDLDDWPVNETDLEAIINSSDRLTEDYIEGLQTTQKGFHTLELLLFGENNNRTVADFKPRKLDLLKALTSAFQQSATDLATSWTEGVEGNPPYREVLATAGNSDNPAYPTVNAAVEEIVQGILGCLDEVANEKIGDPLETKETEGLESRFSHSSLNDFQSNLQSVANAYLGQVPEANTSGQSLSDLIAKANPSLDKQIKQELTAALEAVKAIPGPIETKLIEAEAKMETAQKAIITLFTTMEEKVLPIVQG